MQLQWYIVHWCNVKWWAGFRLGHPVGLCVDWMCFALQFHDAEDAKKALEQLNGFELAGRPMKVGHVTERTAENQGASILDSDEMDRAGIDLGATGRLQLMAKLAEGECGLVYYLCHGKCPCMCVLVIVIGKLEKPILKPEKKGSF